MKKEKDEIVRRDQMKKREELKAKQTEVKEEIKLIKEKIELKDLLRRASRVKKRTSRKTKIIL